jgi:hypothetical protein
MLRAKTDIMSQFAESMSRLKQTPLPRRNYHGNKDDGRNGEPRG